jgi:hypothetical protein
MRTFMHPFSLLVERGRVDLKNKRKVKKKKKKNKKIKKHTHTHHLKVDDFSGLLLDADP